MIVTGFPKPEPWDVYLKNEMSTEFFYLFFGRKEGKYHSRIRDLMRLMSEWISKAEELLLEGFFLLEKDEVWTRWEKDYHWIMMGTKRIVQCWIATTFIKIRQYSISAH